jgi:hypothetical protein
MLENPKRQGRSTMNDDSEPMEPDKANTDGLAALAILLLTAVLILVVVTRLI